MIAHGAYTCDYLNQYIPMTLMGVEDLALGDKIRVEWRSNTKHAYLGKASGSFGATWLIALRTPKGLDHSEYFGTTALATTSKSEPIPSLNSFDVVASGGDHLFILNVPYSWTNLYQQHPAHYAIQIAGKQEFTAFVSSGSSGTSQFVPVTIVGVKKLPFVGNKSKVEAYWGVQPCLGCTAAMKLGMAKLISLTR